MTNSCVCYLGVCERTKIFAPKLDTKVNLCRGRRAPSICAQLLLISLKVRNFFFSCPLNYWRYVLIQKFTISTGTGGHSCKKFFLGCVRLAALDSEGSLSCVWTAGVFFFKVASSFQPGVHLLTQGSTCQHSLLIRSVLRWGTPYIISILLVFQKRASHLILFDFFPPTSGLSLVSYKISTWPVLEPKRRRQNDIQTSRIIIIPCCYANSPKEKETCQCCKFGACYNCQRRMGSAAI